MMRIRNFHIKKRLQVETLEFLANEVHSSDFDFGLLRGAFRDLDTDKSGTLKLKDFLQAFEDSNMS